MTATTGTPVDGPTAPARPRTGTAWIATGARLLLGGAFLVNSIPKIENIDGMARTIFAYDLVDSAVSAALAAAVPWITCMLGAGLLLGVWARGCSLAAVVLIAACNAAAVSLIAREMTVSCACFSLEQVPVTIPQLASHAALLLPAGFVLVAGAGRFAIDGLWASRRPTRENAPPHFSGEST